MSHSAYNQARQALDKLRKQPFDNISNRSASQYFAKHAKTLQTILERDPSSKLDVVEQIQQMIVKITAQSPVKDAERLLELYLIEIETNLP
ncbi:MAG: hypothetical protein AAF383_26870, partial [Cyanobacteria bacterium P01_A01_bin.83]